MAVFHLTTKPISRKSGRTATAAAAYRAAALIQCEYTGLTHDYRNKRGVDYTECVLVDQDGNPTFLDREQLWNAAELSEKRKDARTAREIIVALPHELDAEGRKFAARAFGGRLSQLYGVAVDVCIHQPDKDGDERNYHAHIMMTTRKVTVENGRAILGEKSDLELSDRELRKRYGSDASGRKFINEIRKRWADGVNSILESKGIDARIDHRSHAARGLKELPTIKMGVAATAMERRGEISERGEINRAIRAANAQYHEIQNEIAQAQQAQADERDRITRNIAITDRAIESTDRAINATDQDAERRKRSIEQRKRSAASAHGAVGTTQQHTTATHIRSAGADHADGATDTEISRLADRHERTQQDIERTEQHIIGTAQYIDATEQDITEYDRDTAAATRIIQYIQREIERGDRVDPPPAPPKPKPAPIKLPVTHFYNRGNIVLFIGTYESGMGYLPSYCYNNEIEFDLETQTVISHTNNGINKDGSEAFCDRAAIHAINFLGYEGKKTKDGLTIHKLGMTGYNEMMNKEVGTPLRFDIPKYIDEIKRGTAYATTGEIIPPKEPTEAKPTATERSQTTSRNRDDDFDFSL